MYRVCKHNHEFLICFLQGEKLLILTISDQFSNPYKSTIHMVLYLKSLDDLVVVKLKMFEKLWISIFKFLPRAKFWISYFHGLFLEKWLINDFVKLKHVIQDQIEHLMKYEHALWVWNFFAVKYLHFSNKTYDIFILTFYYEIALQH